MIDKLYRFFYVIKWILIIILLLMAIISRLSRAEPITDLMINDGKVVATPVENVHFFSDYKDGNGNNWASILKNASNEKKALLLPSGLPKDLPSLFKLADSDLNLSVTSKGLILAHSIDKQGQGRGYKNNYWKYKNGRYYTYTDVFLADKDGGLYYLGAHTEGTSNMYGNALLTVSKPQYAEAGQFRRFEYSSGSGHYDDPQSPPKHVTPENALAEYRNNPDVVAAVVSNAATWGLNVDDKKEEKNDFLGGLFKGLSDITNFIGNTIKALFIPDKQVILNRFKNSGFGATFNLYGESNENAYFVNFQWYGVHNLLEAIPDDILETVKKMFTFVAIMGMSAIIYNPFRLFAAGESTEQLKSGGKDG